MTEETEFKLQLQDYFGPLELLYHLIKEDEVDIIKIRLAEVATQYITFIETIKKLDIEVSGEFIEIASHLALIKSRAIVPGLEPEQEEPSLELIQKLLEFRKIKHLAKILEEKHLQRLEKFTRAIPVEEIAPPPDEYKNLTLWSISTTFARLVKQLSFTSRIDLIYQDTPLEIIIQKILSILYQKPVIDFSQLLSAKTRQEIVDFFLAILQLVKDGKIQLEQPEQDKIIIKLI